MQKTILIVEDDAKMRDIIVDFFDEAYNVLEAINGEEAIDIFKSTHVDLLILDIMLPRIDGSTVCRKARSLSNVSIIILTARAHEEDVLLGFELGADDYITKPFSPKELVARSKAILKRNSSAQNQPLDNLKVGPLKIDRLSHVVMINDTEIYLSPTEYKLLIYLIANKDIVLSREQLLYCIWDYCYHGNQRTVDTHVNRLRDKLGDNASLIETVRGFGYKFSI